MVLGNKYPSGHSENFLQLLLLHSIFIHFFFSSSIFVCLFMQIFPLFTHNSFLHFNFFPFNVGYIVERNKYPYRLLIRVGRFSYKGRWVGQMLRFFVFVVVFLSSESTGKGEAGFIPYCQITLAPRDGNGHVMMS